MGSKKVHKLAVPTIDVAEGGVADTDSVLQHRCKDRLQPRQANSMMTCSTSEVAVCCSSDSVSSRVRCCSASNSRTFSIAISAWSAKLFNS